MIFPEGLYNADEFREFKGELEAALQGEGRMPFLLANMTEFGKTPYTPAAQFGDLGYQCVIFPVTALRYAMRGVGEVLDVLRDPTQTVEGAVNEGKLLTRKELYEVLGYTPGDPWAYPGDNCSRTNF